MLVKWTRTYKAQSRFNQSPYGVTSINAKILSAERENHSLTRNVSFFKIWKSTVKNIAIHCPQAFESTPTKTALKLTVYMTMSVTVSSSVSVSSSVTITVSTSMTVSAKKVCKKYDFSGIKRLKIFMKIFFINLKYDCLRD